MKSVTIREAQHNLAKILKDVERGETVEILRRSVPVARLSPVDSVEPEVKPVDWTWVEERRRKIWGIVALPQWMRYSTICAASDDHALFGHRGCIEIAHH